MIYDVIQKRIQGVAQGACAPPIFCNHFEEVQTELFKVELIVNNVPLTLTYVCPNTIETCLTSNH